MTILKTLEKIIASGLIVPDPQQRLVVERLQSMCNVIVRGKPPMVTPSIVRFLEKHDLII